MGGGQVKFDLDKKRGQQFLLAMLKRGGGGGCAKSPPFPIINDRPLMGVSREYRNTLFLVAENVYISIQNFILISLSFH